MTNPAILALTCIAHLKSIAHKSERNAVISKQEAKNVKERATLDSIFSAKQKASISNITKKNEITGIRSPLLAQGLLFECISPLRANCSEV